MRSRNPHVHIWAVVPAAGMGRGIGQPKQALPVKGSTLAGAVVQTLLGADVDGVVVVTRTKLVDALRLPDDERVHVTANDRSGSEMIDSIRIGLDKIDRFAANRGSQAAATDGVLVVPADMPKVTTDACRLCMTAFAADPAGIVIATHKGRRGHPLIFPLALRDTVQVLERGLGELAQRFADRVHLVETDDPGVLNDVDTPEDYRRLGRF